MKLGDAVRARGRSRLLPAILTKWNEPATAVMTAVALHSKADDFCKELALRALRDSDVVAVSILNYSQKAELQIIGSYGSTSSLTLISSMSREIEKTTREKNYSSIRILKLRNESEFKCLALVPGVPMSSSSGVLALLFSAEKPEELFSLETQIALAFACEMYCSPNWAINGFTSYKAKRSADTDPGKTTLTSRQKAVLEYMAEGKTNDRIARQLNYSVATIKNDISAIFQFLGVSNRNDAIEEAQNRSLLSSNKSQQVDSMI